MNIKALYSPKIQLKIRIVSSLEIKFSRNLNELLFTTHFCGKLFCTNAIGKLKETSKMNTCSETVELSLKCQSMRTPETSVYR